jgi:hypothetical protein
MFMDWVDFILDNVSKYGIKNITPLEKKYLDSLQDDDSEEILNQLNMRYEFYESMYNAKIDDDNIFGELWERPSEEENMEHNLYSLWENIEEEDATNFMNIFNVPAIFMNFSYNDLRSSIKTKFKKYWTEYYNF